MIVQQGRIVSNRDSSVKHCEVSGCDVYYSGLVYVPGKAAGQESIECIVSGLKRPEGMDFNDLRGNYYLLIADRDTEKTYAFSDNIGLLRLFRHQDAVGTSLLELIDHFGLKRDTLDTQGVNEFLHFGLFYDNRTLLHDVKRLQADEWALFEGEGLRTQRKGIKPISEPPRLTMDDIFRDMIHAVRGARLSLDLTGGFDSRLIVSYFQKEGIPFELAISGLPGIKDITIAEHVANVLQKPFFPVFHSVEDMSEEELRTIFTKTDGQLDVLSYHRNNQLNRDRQSRKIDVQIGGVGGELYKDTWWIQDFPFYDKQTPNLERLYDWRIESIRFPHHLLEGEIAVASRKMRAETLGRLRAYTLESNTRTYDSIHYHYKINGLASAYVKAANGYFTSYSPLLEPELVRVGFHLPRTLRFFNRFHREIITRNCPRIASIQATEGISTSSAYSDMLLDVARYIHDKEKRLFKQILRKLTNKTYLQEMPTDGRIYSIWKTDELFLRSLESLKKAGILHPTVTPDATPNNLVGRFITLSWLLERLA